MFGIFGRWTNGSKGVGERSARSVWGKEDWVKPRERLTVRRLNIYQGSIKSVMARRGRVALQPKCNQGNPRFSSPRHCFTHIHSHWSKQIRAASFMSTPYGTHGRAESLDGGRSVLPSPPSAARSEGPTNHLVLTLASESHPLSTRRDVRCGFTAGSSERRG